MSADRGSVPRHRTPGRTRQRVAGGTSRGGGHRAEVVGRPVEGVVAPNDRGVRGVPLDRDSHRPGAPAGAGRRTGVVRRSLIGIDGGVDAPDCGER